jgi:hypothetical protein
MLCFVHIPKTAGTTVNVALRRSLGCRYLELEPWVDERRIISPADLRLLKQWAPWVSHFGGHHIRAYSGLEQLYPALQPFTFVRDPVKRYLSDYYHCRYKNGRVANFHEFLSNRAWMNKQTKYIAGTDDINRAKQLLRDVFQFVGVVEEMDASLVMLRQYFSQERLDIRYGQPRNLARRGVAQQEIEEHWSTFHPRILENNAVDLELYAFVCGELLPRQKTSYGQQLEHDVAEFQSTNRAPGRRPLPYLMRRAHYRLLLSFYRRYGKQRWPINNHELAAKHDFFGEYVF